MVDKGRQGCLGLALPPIEHAAWLGILSVLRTRTIKLQHWMLECSVKNTRILCKRVTKKEEKNHENQTLGGISPRFLRQAIPSGYRILVL